MKKILASFFYKNDLNVQMSEEAIELLKDKKLASKIVDAIIINHKKLDAGESIEIATDDNDHLTIATTQTQLNEKTY